jgi:hypothetical protein
VKNDARYASRHSGVRHNSEEIWKIETQEGETGKRATKNKKRTILVFVSLG